MKEDEVIGDLLQSLVFFINSNFLILFVFDLPQNLRHNSHCLLSFLENSGIIFEYDVLDFATLGGGFDTTS